MPNGSRLEPMSMVDSFWLNMDEPTNLMVITAVIELDGILDFDKFRTLLERRLLCFDRFRQRPAWPMSKAGPPYWELDSNFDLQNHIVRVALPNPGDKAALQRMISDLTVVPLDMKKPLWQCHVIENYDNRCALFVRIHHAIADGIALIRLLLSLMDLEPNPTLKGTHQIDENKIISARQPSMIENMLTPVGKAVRAAVNISTKTVETVYRETLKSLAHPGHFFNMTRLFSDIASDSLTILLRLLLLPKDSKTSFKSERIGTRKSVCWSENIPISDVKEIGKAYRATINDILMTAVSGALRKYLIGRNNNMENTEFRVMIPVNVRQLVPKIELGNMFSLVILNLPLYIEDPVKRLREINRRMNELKVSSEAFVGFQALRVMGIPPRKISKKAAKIFSEKVSAILSNVPGPRQPLYIVDRKITNLMFWVPRIGTTALGISILSYGGNVNLGIATDTSLAPDPEEITSLFENEFTIMLKMSREETKKQKEEASKQIN